MRVLPPTQTRVAEPRAAGAERPRAVVPRERTSVTPPELRAALSRAYETVRGEKASPGTLDTITAQALLETGGGTQMYNYNFGGIKGVGPSGLTTSYGTHEVVDGKSVATKAAFRAYRSLDEGAADFVSLLSGRYSSAMERARAGDVRGFAHELKAQQYFTAGEANYADALLRQMPGGASHMRPDGGGAGQSLAHADLREGAWGPERRESLATAETLTHAMDAISRSMARIVEPDGG